MRSSVVIVVLLFALMACNKNKTTLENSSNSSSTSNEKQNNSLNDLIENYLAMKDALVESDGAKTAGLGKKMLAESKILLMDPKNKDVADILSDIEENAEHVSENADKLEHLREHFEILSKDFEDLISLHPYSKTLYKDFCPLANDNKGASWLSDKKEIENPYQGKSMKNCGEIKQEIAAK